MADQTSVRGSGPDVKGHANGSGNGDGVVSRIAGFGNDVFTLAELQAKLAAIDAKECAARATVPLVTVVSAAVLLLAALPVALLGVADLVAYALNVRPGWGMLITAGATAVLAGLLLALFAGRLTTSFETFRRSREELVRNLAWLRTVLVYSGRTAPPRGR